MKLELLRDALERDILGMDAPVLSKSDAAERAQMVHADMESVGFPLVLQLWPMPLPPKAHMVALACYQIPDTPFSLNSPPRNQ